MLPDEVRKAVYRLTANIYDTDCTAYRDAQTIRAHLLAREAEVERLRDDLEREQGVREDAQRQHKRAEALLRETRTIVLELCNCYAHPCPQATIERITAHLSENSRG